MLTVEEMCLELQDSGTSIYSIELGCGAPFVNTLCSIEGASNVFYGGESPYSKEYIREKFRVRKGERFVSKSTVQKILDSISLNLEPNLGIATSFQLGNENRSTHGYVGIKDLTGSWIYHISIHEEINRPDQMNKIGETIVRLVYDYCCTQITIPYVDLMHSKDKDQLSYLLAALPNNDTTTVFMIDPKDGKIKRLEDLLRSSPKGLILYKGSFNPLTNAHVEVLNRTEELYPGYKSVFCISTNTYDKSFSEEEDLLRIKSLLSFGKPILVTNQARFGPLSKIIGRKYKENIVFPMGSDTWDRLFDCNEKNIFNVFDDIFPANLIIFDREENKEKVKKNHGVSKGTQLIEFQPLNNSTSSTEVRQLIREKKPYSHLIPENLKISSEYEDILYMRDYLCR